MAEQPFSRLSPVSFLQTLLAQGISEWGDKEAQAIQRQIAHLGEGAAACFEDAYRAEQGLAGPLDLDAYARMITGIKNQIGGNFARTSSSPATVRVLNHRCPFGQSVTEAPVLCQMTSSVFGHIAARSFGYARVVLEERLAAGDHRCSVAVYTDPARAPAGMGQEYRAPAEKPGRDRIEAIKERLRAFWCEHPGSAEAPAPPALVAESPPMRRILEAVEVAGPTDANVLLTGETGTGKEVIARGIHALGPRARQRFMAVNCGALPEGLFESLLFGHEKGAFTGAHEVHHGYFEQAAAGTLFLDEIDTLQPLAQAKLLRVLQEGTFQRVGGSSLLGADVRVVAASNADLGGMVAAGGFRRDLYYRLNVVPIGIPPLRERPEDLDALVDHFLGRLAEKYGQGVKTLGPRAWTQALGHAWPGNVRELENVLERGYLFTRGSTIETLDLEGGAEPEATPASEAATDLRSARKQVSDILEARILRETLGRFEGNVRRTAAHLNLSTRAVQLKMRAFNIDPVHYRSVPK